MPPILIAWCSACNLNKILKCILTSYLKLESRSILPVHWRYQQPMENQYYVTVSLPGTYVLVRCQSEKNISLYLYNINLSYNILSYKKDYFSVD